MATLRRRFAASLPLVLLLAAGCDSTESASGAGMPGEPAQLVLREVLRFGTRPNFLSPSASGRFLFVSDRSSPFITVLRASDATPVRRIFVEGVTGTLAVAASADGRLLYIVGVGANDLLASVLVYDLELGIPAEEPLQALPQTNQVAVADTPAGEFVLATSFVPGFLTAYDTAFGDDRTIPLDDQPAGLVVTRRRSPPRAYIVGLNRGKIYGIEFDPSRLEVADSLATDAGASLITLSPDEGTAFVSSTDRNQVLVVSLFGLFVTQRISVGSEPLGLDVSPDGRYVAVANSGSQSVSLIDVGRGVAIDELTVGFGPTDVRFAGGDRLYVTLQTEPGLAVLDLRRGGG